MQGRHRFVSEGHQKQHRVVTGEGQEKKKKVRRANEDAFCLSVHAPVRPQTGHHIVLGSDHVSGQPADAIVAVANVVHMGVGDARPVAANTTGIAATVAVLEPGWRCKVQTGERARLPQGVTGGEGQVSSRFKRVGTSVPLEYRRDSKTYGLGITASSSNAETSGVWARMAGLYGMEPPVGVSGRPSRRSRNP